MGQHFKVLYEETSAELVEKKSRFIAYLKPVNSEEEAAAFIDSIKKKHWDARHNCSAVVIGQNNEFSRCSDDGEPSGTAGKPMLEVLLGEQVHNLAVVVTRYFGGVLLGTGGLVRAYQGAVKKALAGAAILEKMEGFEMTIRTDYNGLGKIQYLAATQDVFIRDIEYAENVVVKAMVEEEKTGAFEKKVTEATNGRAVIEKSDKIIYGIHEGCVIL
jgi:uncharacterized YigZ family protein